MKYSYPKIEKLTFKHTENAKQNIISFISFFQFTLLYLSVYWFQRESKP